MGAMGDITGGAVVHADHTEQGSRCPTPHHFARGAKATTGGHLVAVVTVVTVVAVIVATSERAYTAIGSYPASI